MRGGGLWILPGVMTGRPSRATLALPILAGIVLLLGAAAACGGTGPGGARGATPVRYVVCAPGDRDCRVVARFRDRHACERHREVGAMFCDRNVPGQITCRAGRSVTGATAYCTE
jgi:hypothetical protein